MVNSLWRSDAIWWYRSKSTLTHVMACCLTAPSHNLNQCWLMFDSCQSGCNEWQLYESMWLGKNAGTWYDGHILQPLNTDDMMMVNSLWPGDAIWWYRSRSTLTQVMAWCLATPSHYMNKWCSMIFTWCSFTENACNIYTWYVFENWSFKFTTTSPMVNWFRELVSYVSWTTTRVITILQNKNILILTRFLSTLKWLVIFFFKI